MNAPTLSADAINLFRLIHRGGEHVYLWGHTGDPKSMGLTRWFRAGETPAVFNSNHNNYHGVNPTTARGNQYQRAKKGERDVALINCLFAEIDDKDHGGERGAARAFLDMRVASGALPQPTITVDSGGGTQAYWGLRESFRLETPEHRERADRLQKAWVKYAGGDDGAKDLARVLRTPGTLNFKYNPPRPVTIIEADYSRLYSLDDLEALLPPEPTKTAKTRTPRPMAEPFFQDEMGPLADFDAISRAATCLKRFSPARRDSYNTWIEVGMALAGLGTIGYDMWELWSMGSAKYQPGDCADKWPTFRPASSTDDLSLSSLERWANEDDPRGRPESSPEVAQLQRERDEYHQHYLWFQQMLHCEGIKPTEKGVLVGLYPIIAAARKITTNQDRIPLDYGYAAEVLNMSKSTIGRAVEIGEKIGLWQRDPEVAQSKDGYDIQYMRLNLQPAFDDPSLTTTFERKPHGGARPNAGRKPKCAKCPDGTIHRMVMKRTVQYHCPKHGLLDEEVWPDLHRDYLPEQSFQDEIGAESAGIQDEMEEVPSITSVSSLPASVPAAIEDTRDFAAAIHVADTFCPSDLLPRHAYKTALNWLYRKEWEQAADQLPKLAQYPQAQAIVLQLIARGQADAAADNPSLHQSPRDSVDYQHKRRPAAYGDITHCAPPGPAQ